MKKLFLTAAILIGFTMGTYAQQDLYLFEDYQTWSYLFFWDNTPDEQMRGGDDQQDIYFFEDYQTGGAFLSWQYSETTNEGMVGRWFLVFPWPCQQGQLEFRS